MKNIAANKKTSENTNMLFTSNCDPMAVLSLNTGKFIRVCVPCVVNVIMLTTCLPSLLPPSCFTRFSTSSHTYSLHLPVARVSQYSKSFIFGTGKRYNSLSAYVFTLVYDKFLQKCVQTLRGVSRFEIRTLYVILITYVHIAS